jgi:hypothetical protein
VVVNYDEETGEWVARPGRGGLTLKDRRAFVTAISRVIHRYKLVIKVKLECAMEEADMTDSTDELMKSYEVIRSIVERHSQYDAAKILTLNLATCITADSQQDETAALARPADSIRTLCNAVTDMMNVKEDPDVVRELLKRRTQKLN